MGCQATISWVQGMLPPHHRVPPFSPFLAYVKTKQDQPLWFQMLYACNIHFLVGHPCYLTWEATCNAWFLGYMGYTFATLYYQNILKNKQNPSSHLH